MKNKTKLAFEMLEKEMEVIERQQMNEVIGGDGVIRSGTGTASDPYIISDNVFISTNMSSAQFAGMAQAINQINGSPAVNCNGVYYKFSISKNLALSSTNGSNPNTTVTDNYGQATSFRQTQLNYSTGVSPSQGGANAIGTTNSLNYVTIYQAGVNAVINNGNYYMNETEIIRRATIHEMGHVFGIDLDHDPGGNASQNFNNGNAPGMFDASDIYGMLNSGKIHMATDSTGNIQFEDSSLIVSTGVDDIGYFQDRNYSDSSGNSFIERIHPYLGQEGQFGDPDANLFWDNKIAILSSGYDDIGVYYDYSYIDLYGNATTGSYHLTPSTGYGSSGLISTGFDQDGTYWENYYVYEENGMYGPGSSGGPLNNPNTTYSTGYYYSTGLGDESSGS